jgi:hypothetical protein
MRSARGCGAALAKPQVGPLTPRGGLDSIDGKSATLRTGGHTMTWKTPGFVEVRMDAEMTAYADDLDGI